MPWLADIPLPSGVSPPGEEVEEEAGGAGKQPEKWMDLGLQTLR